MSKLLLLPLIIVAWSNRSGTELVVAWLAGLVISCATLSVKLAELTRGQPSRLDFRRIIEKRRLMASHHWLNISISAPRLVLPILVVTIVGAAANASYTVAMLVVGFVNIIPTHLATVLFALKPGDEDALRREVRKTMRICLVLAALSGPFFILFSHVILSVFGASYTSASTALAILGLTTYPMAVKVHFVSISRVRGRMAQAGFSTILGAFFEMGLAAFGGARDGLTGVAVGFLAATVIEMAIYGPVVFGVLRASTRPVVPEPAPGDHDRSTGGPRPEYDIDHRSRCRAGGTPGNRPPARRPPFGCRRTERQPESRIPRIGSGSGPSRGSRCRTLRQRGCTCPGRRDVAGSMSPIEPRTGPGRTEDRSISPAAHARSAALDVSVVMATFNGEAYLDQQLTSLATQSQQPAEVLIGDDGSTDATIQILESFQRSAPFPVEIIHHDRVGVAANFLTTAGRARSAFVAFCDQDDVWASAKIDVLAEAVAAHRCDLVVHGRRTVDSDLRPLRSGHQTVRRARVEDRLRGNVWWAAAGNAMLFRRSLLDDCDWAARPPPSGPGTRCTMTTWSSFSSVRTGARFVRIPINWCSTDSTKATWRVPGRRSSRRGIEARTTGIGCGARSRRQRPGPRSSPPLVEPDRRKETETYFVRAGQVAEERIRRLDQGGATSLAGVFLGGARGHYSLKTRSGMGGKMFMQDLNFLLMPGRMRAGVSDSG